MHNASIAFSSLCPAHWRQTHDNTNGAGALFQSLSWMMHLVQGACNSAGMYRLAKRDTLGRISVLEALGVQPPFQPHLEATIASCRNILRHLYKIKVEPSPLSRSRQHKAVHSLIWGFSCICQPTYQIERKRRQNARGGTEVNLACILLCDIKPCYGSPSLWNDPVSECKYPLQSENLLYCCLQLKAR